VVVGLRLTVLGCCGSFPFPEGGGAASGYLVDDGTTRVWVDAGSGTLTNLQRHLADLNRVDAVVLSHAHPDHWSDLEGFQVACKWMLDRRYVPVYAPAGLREATSEPETATFVWHAIDDGDEVMIGDLRLRFSETGHGPPTLAMRIEGGGRVLGYSADAGPEWPLAALGPGLDLALCEATFQREQEGMSKHLSARQAGETARAAGAARLLLTHLWPNLDREQSRAEGAEAFGAPVELAEVLRSYDV
jgi:ribonuclease BN (tRNA processing enzyme)